MAEFSLSRPRCPARRSGGDDQSVCCARNAGAAQDHTRAFDQEFARAAAGVFAREAAADDRQPVVDGSRRDSVFPFPVCCSLSRGACLAAAQTDPAGAGRRRLPVVHLSQRVGRVLTGALRGAPCPADITSRLHRHRLRVLRSPATARAVLEHGRRGWRYPFMRGRVATGGAREAVSKPVVLLVEDEPLLRNTTGEYLRLSGYVVVEATDAAEAIGVIDRGEGLDLVISDVSLPGAVDGLGLARWLRHRQP